ncbi:DUF5712 family protein [Subsaxibacter sp. CAU 1640]|uniref:MobB family relaxase n=1 Tax=Subsaxibacter sp. CAU 1640 TaxID=2933271 RepID=UPI002003C59A|nr:MobB family relaxase [Subsaxibacter sp. CAU 1640]MCK7591318.1 DUF5712 family protein [Subsaxibacter sp. CAU 1640]
MYITITAQKLTSTYAQSVADFVDYLEKENEGLEQDEMEHFFNQYGDEISTEKVVKDINENTAKLKKVEPKFYSITVNPSKYELSRLQNSSQDLKLYTRTLMEDYVKSFNRELNGKPISINDIKYFAKIEHQRSFKGTDRQIIENQPFATKILQLKQDLRKVLRGELEGNISTMKSQIEKLEKEAPHQQNGKRIVQGMKKDGNQSHIHIIVSRKDASNSISLSPGSKYKSSEVMMNGKLVKRGFDRDGFFLKAEKTFDQTFGYKRNYAESYQSKKDYIKNPKLYFSTLLGLPKSERALAFKILAKSGIHVPSIPTNKVQMALKVINRLKRGVDIAIKSGSIGI